MLEGILNGIGIGLVGTFVYLISLLFKKTKKKTTKGIIGDTPKELTRARALLGKLENIKSKEDYDN